MRRIRIADIVRASGVSRATVDRVLNNRDGVHPETRAVVENAVRSLNHAVEPRLTSTIAVDVLIRAGEGLTAFLRDEFEGLRIPEAKFFDEYQQSDDAIAEQVYELCEDITRPLVLVAKDTSQTREILSAARKRGKTVVAMISDLATEARDAYVGIDNRAAGQSAAFVVGRFLRYLPANVGVVVGDTAFRCHEEREIGFRTTLREHSPNIVLADETKGEDDPETTYLAVQSMMSKNPTIAAIYNVSGGNAGLAKALTEIDRQMDTLVIAHEFTATTVPHLHAGVHDFLISNNPAIILRDAIDVAQSVAVKRPIDSRTYDFGLHTRFNVPSHGRAVWPRYQLTCPSGYGAS